MYYVIEDNKTENQFELSVEGYTAFVTYKIEENTITFIHMEVPYPLKNRGLASAIAKYVLEYARRKKLEVIPNCPFIRKFIKENEEYRDLVKPGFIL
jgi:predicted GNAT family acetyltransferase